MHALLACSGGGHLKQLDMLARRILPPEATTTWLTFDTALARSLLEDRNAILLPYVKPRDLWAAAKVAKRVIESHRDRAFDLALSTGAIPGVAALSSLSAVGVSSHYIESAARPHGPSLSGRLLAMDPLVKTYSQYPERASRRWKYAGSIFDSFSPGVERTSPTLRRVVVTLGTVTEYRFDRLVDRLRELLDGVEVYWQVNKSDGMRLGKEFHERVSELDLKAKMSEADLVIAHAGTGSALSAFEVGKAPLLVPRRVRFHEHVDDHQIQLAMELQRRQLASTAEADNLSLETLRVASGRTVELIAPPAFILR